LLITGLGNPGEKYARTRHNLGFMVADRLADRHSVDFKDGFKGLWGDFQLAGKHFILKPFTFMNLSGQSVAALMNFYKITPEELLVVQDDLDIEFGRIKFRCGGSSGGHKGIDSIISCVGSATFTRLKMGIGRAPHGTVGHVLGRFEDDAALDKFVDLASDAVDAFLKSGLKEAMNSFNNKSVLE
jgi:PTH1 family peptidyl-tRNA hydrolase